MRARTLRRNPTTMTRTPTTSQHPKPTARSRPFKNGKVTKMTHPSRRNERSGTRVPRRPNPRRRNFTSKETSNEPKSPRRPSSVILSTLLEDFRSRWRAQTKQTSCCSYLARPTRSWSSIFSPQLTGSCAHTPTQTDLVRFNSLDKVAFIGAWHPEMLVKQLSTAYRGHAQMCRLLGSWLDASIPETKSSRMSLAKTPDNDVDADTLIFHALKQAIMDRYDPKLLSNVLSDSIAEPEWLNTMLHDRKWRLMLIELAEKHKTCSLLQYAIRRISEAGHHKEIASITNANDVFPVFNAIVADILKRIPFAGVDDVREDYRALEKICAHAAYLYMYTQEALLVLNEALCKDPTMQPARSKLERLRQSLHETVLVKHGAQKLDALHVVKRAAIARPYPALSEAISLVLQENKCSLAACELLKTVYTSSTPPPVAHLREHVILQRLTTALFHPYEAMENAAHRTACAFVLAYAATVQDPRPLLATTTTDTLEWSDEHVQGIAAALEAASIVCKSETTLSYNMNESDAVDKLVRSMAIPVVSMGILHWLQLLLASKTFYNGPFFHAAFPVLLNLLRQAISLHVAQWPTVFQVLVTAVRLQPESNPVKVLETKKETLRCLVHLMTCGYIFPVLHFIATQTDDLDQALLRNFIQLVLARIAPPYSLRFTTALSRILVHPKVSQALRTCPAETKTKLKEFVHVCQAEDGLATEIRHILRDCYEDN
ncbi:hypothetical protein, variant 1 [Aphanomyces invadans]|uniref:Uncharacterized protein n=1 Tax=Aphanomyces invadans TaxID=157072 RepID=A0A024U2W8_9STRA|nr:hypothetical protein, variant 1 [Aphanomyces invadans]ETW00247.1 hypothetical protein, variant 1 [Aphanomyces invadans]|eukprot:XP_008871272.1 hypothetical protein, variant 1 [Aphanomyces invadans]